jgi:hypothetical protein
MNLSTIEAPIEEAKAKLDEYRNSVKDTHDETDRQIMKGYQALAEGKSLIHLRDAIATGGFNPSLLPNLAVGRMTDPRINVRVYSDRLQFFPAAMGDWVRNDNMGLNSGVVRIAIDRPAPPVGVSRTRDRASAIVPLVPPALRPKKAKHRYFVLFEADWLPVPPRDPALIRHLVGELWVVLATWDLTDLERAAIAGR